MYQWPRLKIWDQGKFLRQFCTQVVGCRETPMYKRVSTKNPSDDKLMGDHGWEEKLMGWHHFKGNDW